MTDNDLTFTLVIQAGAEADPGEALDRALNLRAEMLSGPASAAESRQAASAPEHGKGPGVLTPELAVTLAAAALPSAILLVQSWLLRQKGDRIRVKIKEVELEVPRDATRQEIEKLVKIVEKAVRRVK